MTIQILLDIAGRGTACRARTRMGGLFFGIVLVIAMILSNTSVVAATVQANAKSVSGKVEFSQPGSAKFEPLKTGQTLAIGSNIKTGADGVAILLTVPGAAVRVGPNSQLTLTELDFEKAGEKIIKRKAALDLKTGTVSALIEHNSPDTTDFRIKTPQGIAAARGTFYGVTVEDGKAHVAVQEGKVGIQANKPADSKEAEKSK